MVRAVVLKVIDGGRIVEERSVGLELLETVLKARGDLGTDWFGRILMSALAAVHHYVVVKRVDGEKDGGGSEICFQADRHLKHVWIGVGRGTTPPTRQDYNLEVLESVKPATADYKDGLGVVVSSASFYFDKDTDISEVGLFLCQHDIERRDPGLCVLLDRTVLETPVHVSAGQTLYVEYRIAI